MSARDRDWLLSLIAAVLLTAFGALLFVVIVPWLLAGMGPVDWMLVSVICVIAAIAVITLGVCGAAAMGDEDTPEPSMGDEVDAITFDWSPR